VKILVLSNLYPPHALGGYEILCQQVVDRLRARGHRIEVLTSTFGGSSTVEPTGVDGYAIRRELILEAPFGGPADTRRRHRLRVGEGNAAIVHDRIRAFRPDIVFVWSLLRLGVAPARAAEESGVPVAYTLNDINLAGYSPRRPSLSPRRLLRALLDRTVHRRATLASLRLDYVTCISAAVRAALVARGAPVADSRVLYQGIPLERFPFTAPSHSRHGPLRVLYTGQLHEYKGVHVLLEAARRCRCKLSVTIVGTGDPEYEAHLRAIAPSGVEFLGHLPHDQLPALYREHDVFVFPSLRDEAFGLTWIEAMASGTPVVATPAGGQAEVLADGVNALVVPPGDPDRLADALARLASDRKFASRIAVEGRRVAETQLSLDRYVEDLERFLCDAESGRRRCSVAMVPRRFTSSSWGGTETVVLETGRRLVDRGHSVEIFTSSALSSTSASTIGGLPVRRFPYFYPFLGLSSPEVARLDRKGGNLFSFSLLRALRRRRPALIHLHTLKRLGGIGRWVARRLRIPYIVSLHGNVLDVPADERAELLAPIRRRFEWGRVLGFAVGSRRVLDDASAILCVSRSETKLVQERYPDQSVIYLPHGVDCRRFWSGDGVGFRSAHGIPAGRKVVLTVGRIDPQKNQQQLVSALAHREDLHLLMIGPVTHPEYAEELRTAIREHGIEDRVTLIEGLGYDDRALIDAYHAADVFCLPSLHEPFGIVLLEAWSAGLPVAAARVGGPCDLVENGVDGVLFDPRDASDLARAVDRSLASASKFGKAGHAKVEREYDWRKITGRLADCYEQVIRKTESAA